jgi:hypothetical protein
MSFITSSREAAMTRPRTAPGKPDQPVKYKGDADNADRRHEDQNTKRQKEKDKAGRASQRIDDDFDENTRSVPERRDADGEV